MLIKISIIAAIIPLIKKLVSILSAQKPALSKVRTEKEVFNKMPNAKLLSAVQR